MLVFQRYNHGWVVPLAAMMDYRGHRGIATCLYPIDGNDTLILGRCDLDGKQIFVDRCDAAKRAILKEALGSLNLSEHQILVRKEFSADAHGVVGPCDLESSCCCVEISSFHGALAH